MTTATDNRASSQSAANQTALSAVSYPQRRLQFRLLDVVLITTLVAMFLAAVVQFSGWLLLAFVAAGLLCLRFAWRVALWKINLAVVALLLSAMLLTAVQSPRRPAGRSICGNNLYQISKALIAYEANRGKLPPAYIADQNGKPMHSWRVLILPYLGRLDLYEAYRFDEPWDGPNNRKLAREIMRVYSCPNSAGKKTDTSYVAIVGPNTLWPGSTCGDLTAIPDGASNVVLLVEVHRSGIHWMEPRDLDASLMASVVNPQNAQGISSGHPGGAMVTLADGHTFWLSAATPPSVVRSLINIHDGTLPLPD